MTAHDYERGKFAGKYALTPQPFKYCEAEQDSSGRLRERVEAFAELT